MKKEVWWQRNRNYPKKSACNGWSDDRGHLNRQMDALMESLQINNGDEIEAADFLQQGPQTAIQESRLAAS